MIRAIWAYTCAIYKVSKDFGANHPNLLMFDEPGQHSMSDENLRNLFVELSKYTDTQTIVAASFNNDETVYQSTTKDISFHLVEIKNRLIEKIN